MKRILLAGLLGGIAMFLWSSVAHLVLPLGQAGIGEIPNEQPVLTALRSSLGASSGLYLFPGLGPGPDAMRQYGQLLAANPSGLLIYHPPGAQAMTAGQLATEFIAEVIQALLLAVLLARTRLTGFGSRLGFVFVAAVLAALGTNVSYWNWYGFPATYTAAYITTQIVGLLCAGLVAAALLKKPGQAS
jgi:hypothetical protein